MPYLHFVDKELNEELKKLPTTNNSEEDNLEDYQFIANCLRVGLKIQDLKEMQYKDVAKIMLCFIRENKQEEYKNATQNDIDNFLR